MGVGAGAGRLCPETRGCGPMTAPGGRMWTPGRGMWPHLSSRSHTCRDTLTGREHTHTHSLLWSHHRVTHIHPHVHVYVLTDMVRSRSQHPPTYVCGDICTIKYSHRVHTHTVHGLRDVHPPVGRGQHSCLTLTSRALTGGQLSAGRGWPETPR